MSMEWVRKNYHVPAKRGRRVKFFFAGKWNFGTIKSATHHLKIAPDEFPKNRLVFHPADVQYID